MYDTAQNGKGSKKMKRTILKKIFIVSGILLALLVIWMGVSVACRYADDTGVGIVGGADRPTALFVVQTHPAYGWVFPVLVVFAGTAIALLVQKRRK